ncbi:peptidase S66 family protein [Actinotalea ferrariae CF5-4]|uniref:Peptidase S66 family protein n=1 Tax=Actinotalea ferrariae CF5-4 TaxID=948458 RepID=A0A021VQ52_9CELL|nr:S66 peptidase family protein [Actinotalea ferrariae]EYR63276.1 peptidase S66 family protein [Actinotalea ferrariae CF5-4]
MPVRYPLPLRPGDRVAVTAPSSGVAEDLRPRLAFAVEHLRGLGFDVVLGECLDGAGVVSAPPAERAAELTAFLTDPTVRAVVPPWGGELAVELLPHLDLDAMAAAEPAWLVGYSDLSTLLLPLTTTSGVATLYGQNLMDTPYAVPAPLLPWWDVVGRDAGSGPVVQGASTHHRAEGFDRWQDDPTTTAYTLPDAGTWSLLDGGTELRAQGRLVGGCVETVSMLAGTPWGDVRRFADEHAPGGLVVYLDPTESHALDMARHLWRLRLAGWFDRANAVLVARTRAPSSGAFTQRDALRSALEGLDVPVVVDVDCGHVPPHLALVNGALAEVVVTPEERTLVQHLG